MMYKRKKPPNWRIHVLTKLVYRNAARGNRGMQFLDSLSPGSLTSLCEEFFAAVLVALLPEGRNLANEEVPSCISSVVLAGVRELAVGRGHAGTLLILVNDKKQRAWKS